MQRGIVLTLSSMSKTKSNMVLSNLLSDNFILRAGRGVFLFSNVLRLIFFIDLGSEVREDDYRIVGSVL